MAIYHLSVKNISRKDGRSAVAAAAYRAGARLRNEAEDRVSDFSRRSGVAHSEILLPDQAPGWMADREALWNAVETAESRKDARLAKEVEIALPIELGGMRNITLARQFTREMFARRGIVADLSVHDAGDGNPHAHIMLATRSLAPDGFGSKDRRLDDRAFLSDLREKWEVFANDALEQHGAADRIDHRTLEAQGIKRAPQEHHGPRQERTEQVGQPAREKPPLATKKIAESQGSEDAGEENQSGSGDSGGTGKLVDELDHAERRLTAYLSSTAAERERARKRDEALQELHAYHLRIQRQELYLENLRQHQRKAEQRHRRAVEQLHSSFGAVYRKPDHAFASIWRLLFSAGPDLFSTRFRRKSPALFGALNGWSFLVFDSPKRKKAKQTATVLPQRMLDWYALEAKVKEIDGTALQVEQEMSRARDRATQARNILDSHAQIALDPERDREIRIRLYQTRNQLLARVEASDIASSSLSPDRQQALLVIAARFQQQRVAVGNER